MFQNVSKLYVSSKIKTIVIFPNHQSYVSFKNEKNPTNLERISSEK
jgi:hypothetical protein